MNDKKSFQKGLSIGLLLFLLFSVLVLRRQENLSSQYYLISLINVGNTKESVNRIEDFRKITPIEPDKINVKKLDFVPDDYKSKDCRIYKSGKYYMFVFFKDDVVFTRYITYIRGRL